ncbi:hypothetical protein A0J61_10952, partial [Choanephora cucurbitarum]
MVRDRLYGVKQSSSIQSYVDTFMDISMLLNTNGLSAQEIMDRFLTDIFFRGLRDMELVQRIRGIRIEDRTLDRVLRESLDFEAAHNPAVHPTAHNNANPTNNRRSSGYTGTAIEPPQAVDDPMDCDILHSRRHPVDDPMDCDILHSRRHQQGSLTGNFKDNRGPRSASFAGACCYCSRQGHKSNKCRTRAKDLANYESRMKEKYRNNRSGSSGPSRKPTLNAIDTTVTDADCDCSPSSSTSHNKATDSSSYLSSVSSQLSQNVVISS